MQYPDNTAFLDIKTAKIKTPEYPMLLGQITDPPQLLYYRGSLPKCAIAIAIVGSRKMSVYGEQVLDKIITALAGQDICIISGLAYGVDAYAHKIALKAKLKTIAVLGSGIDDQSIYPAANQELAIEILKSGGAIVSEYPPGTASIKYHFPMRNRIIAGLSNAIVVVEAAAKSGALITAQNGLEQNRDIFAVPGSIFNITSEGTNELIKNGAKLINSAADLINEYSVLSSKIQSKAKSQPTNFDLTELEQKVFNCIKDLPISTDQIQSQISIEISLLNSILITLEIKDIIRNCGAQNYIRKV